MEIRLPFLGDKTYQAYAATAQRILDARAYASDPLVRPDESVALTRHADRLDRGLRTQKIVDAVQSLNICALQVAATAFLPAALMGAATVAATCGVTLVGGLVIHIATTLAGRDLVTRAVLKDPNGMRDAMVFADHLTVMNDRRRLQSVAAAQVNKKVEQFGKVLDKVVNPPADPPIVEREPEGIRIAGIRVPVRREAPLVGQGSAPGPPTDGS